MQHEIASQAAELAPLATAMIAALSFPDLDPVAVQIGPIAIRWYALAYIAGLLLGWRYALHLARTPRYWPGVPPITKTQLDDLLLWAAIGVVVGGRLGYVLLYKPGYYFAHPLEIPAIWSGGMSFHGGAIGVLVALVLFARARAIPVASLADVAAASAPIGLFFGRIANFINSELWGRPSDVPWAVVFPNGGPLPRHPSQLYEAALEGLVLFLVLHILISRFDALKKPGVVFGAFIAGYGVARTVAEFFREPDAHIGYIAGFLTMGMILSLPMVVVGLAIAWWAARRAGKAQAT